MKKSGVNITDIAREAGVSIATVSRILNQDDELRVSDLTRARVMETALQLGYSRNPIAAALRSNRSGIIGALSPNLAGTFLGLLMQELQQAARARGIELLIGTPEVESAQIEGQLRRLQGLLFDGFLLLSDQLNYQATIRHLEVLQKPYISVCAGVNIPPPFVTTDEALAVQMAVDYLIELGHRRIAYLGSPHWPQESHRLEQFRLAMAAKGLAVVPAYLGVMEDIAYVPFGPHFREMWTQEPLRAAQQLLALAAPPTAIFCANDGFAIAAMKGALQLGLRVPEDVSIMGYNDELPSTLFHPELTTIRQPLDLIAAASIDLLHQMIEAGEYGAAQFMEVTHLLPPQLVIRGTCAAPTT
jgi:LacI family transcriptional regulator